MSATLVGVLAFFAFLAAYHSYGRKLASHLLGLDPKRITPARSKQDGVDYVPSNRAVFIAVVVVGFAMTTLDSGTRLLRYNLEGLGSHFRPLGALTRNRHTAGILAVLAIGYFAVTKVNGRPAGITLWALFGITNQLVGALGFLVMTLWFFRAGRPFFYLLLPMLFMMAITLVGTGIAILVLDLWLIAEAAFSLHRLRRERRAARLAMESS